MMRIKLYLILAGFAAIYGIYAIATVDRTDDRQQIKVLIQNAVDSAQKRDIGNVMSCVSKAYKDENDINYDRLRLLAARAFRADFQYRIRANLKSLQIRGEKATVELHALVEDFNGTELYNRHITLILRKEPARHMLFVPVKVWRVISTRNLGLSYEM
jgi:hypothetical protein